MSSIEGFKKIMHIQEAPGDTFLKFPFQYRKLNL